MTLSSAQLKLFINVTIALLLTINAECKIHIIHDNFQGSTMIYSTLESIPGKEIKEVVGIVTGNVVQAKHIGRDIMAGLKSIVGGEIRGYTEMLTDARDIAVSRLIENAHQKGADAVVGIRFTTSTIMDGSSEIMVFGTAVKLNTE